MRNSERYSRSMIGLHWLTAILVITAYLASESNKHFEATPPRVHVIAGLAVLVFTILRVLIRSMRGVPSAISGTRSWTKVLTGAGHAALYFLLLVVPLSGWFALSRLGLRLGVAGVQLPWLTAPVAGAPGLIANLHQVGGNLLIIIAALHAGVGLWHFFWLRDRTLQRILPPMRLR